jgi:CRP/FNR family transcriptional regulator, cyclic AMP receptor protein
MSATRQSDIGPVGGHMRSQIDINVIEQLRKVYIFEEVSSRHLDKIAQQGKIVDHEPGHTLMTEGRTALGFHLLLEGEAEVLVHGAVRRTVGPGDYVGEIAVIDGKPRTATVRAKTPVRAWAISDSAFKTLLEKEPGLALAVLKGLCGRVREAEAIPVQA